MFFCIAEQIGCDFEYLFPFMGCQTLWAFVVPREKKNKIGRIVSFVFFRVHQIIVYVIQLLGGMEYPNDLYGEGFNKPGNKSIQENIRGLFLDVRPSLPARKFYFVQ